MNYWKVGLGSVDDTDSVTRLVAYDHVETSAAVRMVEHGDAWHAAASSAVGTRKH